MKGQNCCLLPGDGLSSHADRDKIALCAQNVVSSATGANLAVKSVSKRAFLVPDMKHNYDGLGALPFEGDSRTALVHW